ncbi:hypothetical protein CHRY9390_01668 [Chryseobacterium aquaeductus]|uniref:Uncharacterized protein n=1 Tax=Chryseobacterium aquaeductus TaxID=2675056 RepID=A0A9N8QSG6_9FLAO|nr:DUF5687 family protein [Chryseobacterium aquaeductus]CAA7330989.1 hypothetical protein CHRY9390_01668 [Chryseobacterium potabilaquae]CAD7807511.1 hypothetical protein CHRY9390_01668 [Chryseobacterium aquaeductus]
MFVQFLRLEIKSFFRGTSVGVNLAMKIFRFLGIISIVAYCIGAAFLAFFYVSKEMEQDPVKVVSKFMIILWVADLIFKYMLQQMSTQNIKPFLTLNISKKTLVNYMLIKTFLSPFSWMNSFFFVTFAVICMFNGFGILGSLSWLIALSLLFYLNNFINILLNNKENIAIAVGILFAAIGGLGYYNIIPILNYSEKLFYSFYDQPYFTLLAIALFAGLWWICFHHVKKEFYLDQGLEDKKTFGKTENIAFLNKYGAIGSFINNDIKMLRRNKVTKGVLIGSFMFIFYGLLMFSSPIYKTPYMMMFMGLFVTGGFQFLFGQRVPSFDSSYYPLMMTLNVPYKEYLKAKWWLMNIVTAASIVIALFYAIISWEVYFSFFAAGLYNIGVNSQFTLWSGAYTKTQIDLNSKEKVMGQKNSFNMKSLLLLIPKMLLPMAVFGISKYFFGMTAAVVSIAILGMIGFLFREKIFDIIVKQYKSEKYSTLDAFKSKN